MNLVKCLKKYLRNLKYDLINIKKLDYTQNCTQNKSNQNNIIVSLTTIPSRIGYIKPVIYSLLSQTHKPNKIELNLALKPLKNDISWKVPRWLENLDAVEIFWLDHDYGPASKFIPTLIRHKDDDAMVIVVDDDMFYPKDLIETFVYYDSKVFNSNAVLCSNGHLIAKNLNFADSSSSKRIEFKYSDLKNNYRKVAIIEGCGGYCLRSKFFNLQELQDTANAPKGCILMDDVWISGHLSRHGIEKIQIPTSKRKSLLQTNILAIPHDRLELNNKMLQYFSADWLEKDFV